jgi:molybdopterin biosynthesis enzyme
VRLPLLSSLPASKGREVVLPARLGVDPQGSAKTGVDPVRLAGSADLAHFSTRDLLIIRPPNAPAAKPGEPVDVLMWPEPA